jgi:predicted phosphodiesterase
MLLEEKMRQFFYRLKDKQNLLILVITILFFSSCFRPAEDNANNDTKVGKASVAGANIIVEGGLATVREAYSGSVTLWLQAPVQNIHLNLTNSTVTNWQIVLQNAVPNTLFLNPGAIPYTESQDKLTYTVNLSLVSGNQYNLSFGPADYNTSDSFAYAVLGDIQNAIDSVRDIYQKMNSDTSLRFLIIVGDLVQRGARNEYLEFISKASLLNIPFYGTPGNHDVMSGGADNWYEYFGRCNVFFQFKNTAFSLIDSSYATIDPTVYKWLKGWSSSHSYRVHYFFTHIPPIDPVGIRSGSFRSKNEAYKLLAILAGANVDSTFYGHVHAYHPFSNAGIPAYITGGGGGKPEQFVGFKRHFLKVTVNPAAQTTAVSKVDVD